MSFRTRLIDALWTIAAGVALVAVSGLIYVLARASNALQPVPCLLDELSGGGKMSQACREALASGRVDPWAPAVRVVFGLVVLVCIVGFLVQNIRLRDWRAVGFTLLWVAALTFAIIGIGTVRSWFR